MPRRDRIENHPPIPCWFCWRPLLVTKIVQDGIILGREEEQGGPERLFICPSCLKENLCEETPKGRWFASPRISVGLLEILFSKLPGAASEEVLQAISWYRENEERRRYFFLRDGDRRYMGKNFLLNLWPWWNQKEVPRRKRTWTEADWASESINFEQADTGKRSSSSRSHGPSPGTEKARSRKPPPRETQAERPRIITPYEILGLRPGANAEEIRKAFHRLAVQYHPDKVHHLGEEFRNVAHVKFLELKRAYETLMSRR